MWDRSGGVAQSFAEVPRRGRWRRNCRARRERFERAGGKDRPSPPVSIHGHVQTRQGSRLRPVACSSNVRAKCSQRGAFQPNRPPRATISSDIRRGRPRWRKGIVRCDLPNVLLALSPSLPTWVLSSVSSPDLRCVRCAVLRVRLCGCAALLVLPDGAKKQTADREQSQDQTRREGRETSMR